jgi:hypothetical protein
MIKKQQKLMKLFKKAIFMMIYLNSALISAFSAASFGVLPSGPVFEKIQ